MTELTFSILKYGFLVLLWVFVWLAVRGLHNDVAAGLHRGRRAKRDGRAAQPQVLVGGSGPSLVSTPAPVQQGQKPSAERPAGPAPAPPAPQRRPLSGTSDPIPVEKRRSVLAPSRDLPANPGQDNASESSDLANLVAGVASEKREQSKTALPVPTMLTIIDGPRAGSTFTLEGSAVTIGRAPDNTVVLHDEYISGHHCQLVPARNGQWRLEDLGSTNGTYVNESRIRQPEVIPVGTPVRIGATTFTLR